MLNKTTRGIEGWSPSQKGFSSAGAIVALTSAIALTVLFAIDKGRLTPFHKTIATWATGWGAIGVCTFTATYIAASRERHRRETEIAKTNLPPDADTPVNTDNTEDGTLAPVNDGENVDVPDHDLQTGRGSLPIENDDELEEGSNSGTSNDASDAPTSPTTQDALPVVEETDLDPDAMSDYGLFPNTFRPLVGTGAALQTLWNTGNPLTAVWKGTIHTWYKKEPEEA